MDEKVEEIIKQVIEETDAEREEITKKIEEKQEELSGFITPEGAATIVARSHGVTPEREEPEVRKLRIEDISEGMSNVDIVGVVARTLEPREFERKDGSKGKVANLVLMDDTDEVRTVFWDQAADLIAKEEIQKGTPLRLKGAYVKKGRDGSPELNMGRRGEIEIDPTDDRAEELPSAPDAKIKISELDPDLNFVDVVGRLIAVTEPREFERANGSTGKVATLRIVDETGQSRVSLWGEMANRVEKLEPGDAIRLENASVREGWQNTPEIHINQQARIVRSPSPKETENLPEFEKKFLKIEEIEPDMPVLDVVGRVQRTFPPSEFSRDDGSSGKVMNVVLADETGTIRVSFWDDMVETGQKLSRGDILLLENAKTRVGLQDRAEIRIGRQTTIEINPEDVELEEIKPSKMKISELEEGLDSLETSGRVIDSSEIREFTRSDGEKGEVANITLGDETGTIKVTLWGSKTDIMNKLEPGDTIKITGAYTVPGDQGKPEIQLGEQANVEMDFSPEESLPPIEEIEKEVSEKGRMKIENLKENIQAKIRGTIVQVFQRRPLFDVCPNCGRNVKTEDSEALCEECGESVKPEHRTVVNVIVDDGTDNIRAVAFGKLGEKLIGKSADELAQALENGKELSELYKETSLASEEIILAGRVKRDDYYDQLEIRASEIEFPNPEEETKKLLEKIKA